MDQARRKELRPTARARCLVDRVQHRLTDHSTQRHPHQPLQLSMDNRPFSHVSSVTSSLAADQTSLRHPAAGLSACGPHCWGRPSNIHNQPRQLSRNLHYATVYELRHNKYCYMCVNVTVITSNPTVSHMPLNSQFSILCSENMFCINDALEFKYLFSKIMNRVRIKLLFFYVKHRAVNFAWIFVLHSPGFHLIKNTTCTELTQCFVIRNLLK